MRKRTLFAVITVELCAIVAAGGLLATNMGFKLNYRLNGPAAGVSNTGKNTLSLPYFRQVGLNDAEALGHDLGGRTIVTSISMYRKASDTFCVYVPQPRVGGTPCPVFALSAGDGYFLSMASNVNYIVVGGHDPSLVINLLAAGPGSATGKNLVAPPYNFTSLNALELMQDIGGGSIAPVSSVSKFLTLTDSFEVYTGRMGSPSPSPFLLRMGEAYFVSMASTVPWTPSHF